MKRRLIGQLGKHRLNSTHSVCLLVLLVMQGDAAEQAKPSSRSPVAALVQSSSNLENVLRVNQGIYTGSEPVNQGDFRWLADQGVDMIVSVDRVPPDVETAAAFGIRYVHIPMGYDRIDREQQLAIVRAVRETRKCVYFHCHRGHHRGPAATAIACMSEGLLSSTEAKKLLEIAGTNPNYKGLWDAVQDFVSPTLNDALPELQESVEPAPLAESMARIDRSWRAIQSMNRKNWSNVDAKAIEHVRLLSDGLRVSAKNAGDDFDRDFQRLMKESIERASGLEFAVEQGDLAGIGQAVERINLNCQTCHQRFRD